MIIKPKVRGFICTTAHPKGCEINVKRQIEYVKNRKKIDGAKRVLVIGASTGYGLASRITSAFGCGASTIGVSFERRAGNSKTATPGWYNTAAFEKYAIKDGLYAKSIDGDAFSDEVKEQVISLIKDDLGQIDLVVYSLASPRRIHPKTGEKLSSVIKPIGNDFCSKSINTSLRQVIDAQIPPATDDEVRQTVAVMGGDDLRMWIDALDKKEVLAKGAICVSYSYIGPTLTHAIYKDGTIGMAKIDLENTSRAINEDYKDKGYKAYVSVNKALVTQASSAIPVVPLYISMLIKNMREKGIDEGCIEQIYRLYNERLYCGEIPLDDSGRIRIDDLEMQEDVQKEILTAWDLINNENLDMYADLNAYNKDFLNLFGFEIEGVDYEEDIDENVEIPSIKE